MAETIKINKSLLLFSWIYGLAVWIRNKLFDWKILPAEEFSVPVISVGNITAGGTGKTPHTEYLVHLLKSSYKVAVLSRGYKRKTSGFILADSNASFQTIGDEPYQLYRKFPDILVAVDAKRKRGIKKLLALPAGIKPNVILLDDAFQHRYITPSLSIVLISKQRLIYDDMLLPAGRLRESSDNIDRAQIVIVTKCPQEFRPFDFRIISKNLHLFPYQSLFYTSFDYGVLHPVFHNNTTDMPLSALTTKSALVIAGIANPEDFAEKINEYAAETKCIRYGDHHSFTKKNYEHIASLYKSMPAGNTFIIMTEKDAVRIEEHPALNDEMKYRMFYLPIKVIFHLGQQSSFNKKIENHVRNLTRNRIMA